VCSPSWFYSRKKASCKYILLGGNSNIVPTNKNCWAMNYDCGWMGSDLYYADCGNNDASGDIYQAWDENDNNVFGEPFIHYVSLQLSRSLARTKASS